MFSRLVASLVKVSLVSKCIRQDEITVRVLKSKFRVMS